MTSDGAASMTYMATELIQVRDFPLDLRAALAAEADEDGTSVADITVSILSRCYGVKWEPTMRPSTQHRGKPAKDFSLRMPTALATHLRVDAATSKRTFRAVVLTILCAHYQMVPPSLVRRQPTKEKTT